MMSVGILGYGSSKSLGTIGIAGNIDANTALVEADLILFLGCRIVPRSVHFLIDKPKDAIFMRVDIDEQEIMNPIIPLHIDYQLKMDLQMFMPIFYETLKRKTCEIGTLSYVDEYNHDLTCYPKKIFETLYDETKGNIVLTVDAGIHLVWASRFYHPNKPRQLIIPCGFGAMAYAISTAIGAYFASDLPIFCVLGDGGFQMSCQELATIIQYNIKVVILLINNSCLGFIKDIQKKDYNSRYYSVDLFQLDYKTLAITYGLNYFHIDEINKFRNAIKESLKCEKSTLIEIVVSDEENTYYCLEDK